MIKISRLADYAVVILSHLANTPDGKLSAKQLSTALALPPPTVSKLLKQLHEALLVTSTRGVNGGYQLARAPQEITIAEIVTAIEGPFAMTECAQNIFSCKRTNLCDLRHNWQYINQMLVNLFDQLSLDEMRRPLRKILTVQALDE